MTHKTQKIITTLLVAWVVMLGFEALIYLLRLNQEFFFVRVAFYIYLYLIIKIALLYDLHFKNRNDFGSALSKRFHHLFNWRSFRHFQNYLLLPTLVYWATVGILYVNFGNLPLQQGFALASSVALIANFWHLKEVFHRGQDTVDADIFRWLSIIKLYAAFLLYAASLGIARYYCIEFPLYLATVFIVTFWLMYQAMFQHSLVSYRNLAWALAGSLLVTGLAFLVFVFWGLNYFTAGVFLVAWYNFFWNIIHHFLAGERFDYRVFLELLLVTLLISFMMVGVTNFKARLLNAC